MTAFGVLLLMFDRVQAGCSSAMFKKHGETMHSLFKTQFNNPLKTDLEDPRRSDCITHNFRTMEGVMAANTAGETSMTSFITCLRGYGISFCVLQTCSASRSWI